MAQHQETSTQAAQPSANGHRNEATAPAAANAKGGYFAVQNRWLQQMRGRAVSIRLQSGDVITGVLEGDDSYTLALRIPGAAETALVYKHSIEYLVPAGRR